MSIPLKLIFFLNSLDFKTNYQWCCVKGHIDKAWVSNNDDEYAQNKTLSGDGVHLSGLGHQVFIMSLKSSTTMGVGV